MVPARAAGAPTHTPPRLRLLSARRLQILGVSEAFKKSTDANKLNLGVGAYRLAGPAGCCLGAWSVGV